VQFKFQEKYNL